jgi:HD-GYP domain-containing protein (c-di-GMP phosphodiesterase class II)
MPGKDQIDISEVILCLGKIAQVLRDDPQEALKQLRAIGERLDVQIPYRDGHTLRVVAYCLEIADMLGFTPEEKALLEAAALLHDFGKVGVREDVLMKPAELTEKEKKEVETHVLRGYFILEGFRELAEVLGGIRSHHEHYNGSGYPDGLTGGDIPLIARIIAVADAYDAMTSDRPYRARRAQEDAEEELLRLGGIQFDPAIVKIFIVCLKRKKLEA